MKTEWCTRCNGCGYVRFSPRSPVEECPNCNGTGKAQSPAQSSADE